MYNGRYQTARNGAELKSDNTKVQPSAVVKRIKRLLSPQPTPYIQRTMWIYSQNLVKNIHAYICQVHKIMCHYCTDDVFKHV